MTTFDRVNRRTHLYLGLFLMPWLLMYGVSSFIISHHAWFRSNQQPPWEVLFEREYRHLVPAQGDLREVAGEILKDCGLAGAYRVQRPKPDEIQISRFRFWDETRLTYFVKDQRLRAEHQRRSWEQSILRMHFRSGYDQASFLNDLWGFMVDLACAGILVWIVSGLVMWWRLPRMRAWGAIAVGAGLLSFLLLVWSL